MFATYAAKQAPFASPSSDVLSAQYSQPYELFESSAAWHQGEHDLTPWLLFFLGIVRRAHRELEAVALQAPVPRGGKTAVVETAIKAFAADFTFAELAGACPSVSPEMVRKVLRQAKGRGEVRPLGRGPGALQGKLASVRFDCFALSPEDAGAGRARLRVEVHPASPETLSPGSPPN